MCSRQGHGSAVPGLPLLCISQSSHNALTPLPVLPYTVLAYQAEKRKNDAITRCQPHGDKSEVVPGLTLRALPLVGTPSVVPPSKNVDTVLTSLTNLKEISKFSQDFAVVALLVYQATLAHWQAVPQTRRLV